MKTEQVVHISAPDFGVLELVIHGTAPLVIHRFSKKIDLMANYVDLLKPEAA